MIKNYQWDVKSEFIFSKKGDELLKGEIVGLRFFIVVDEVRLSTSLSQGSEESRGDLPAQYELFSIPAFKNGIIPEASSVYINYELNNIIEFIKYVVVKLIERYGCPKHVKWNMKQKDYIDLIKPILEKKIDNVSLEYFSSKFKELNTKNIELVMGREEW